uniref:tRNA selenocysteine 1-associated protein 1 n=1 Tax=Poecilia reticulata TaxID=8081 RepID=A0A3P9Q556_POERE
NGKLWLKTYLNMLETYMDEKFITRAFSTMGEQVVNVRIIRNKMTGGALGYCFVEMSDEATAERCLRKVNGKSMPGASPPTRFKLNRATFGKQEAGSGYRYGYDQYDQYQQQAYPGYYSSWGYDQTAGMYGYTYPQYDYSQYAQVQVSSLYPSLVVDVVETNRSFIDLSEELYDAITDCHWQPPEFSANQDYIVSNLPDPISI